MTKQTTFAAVLIVASLTSNLLPAAEMTEVSLEKLTIPTHIEWHHSLKTASEIAVIKNKPLVLFFTASWCGPCQNLKRTTMRNPSVIREMGTNYVPVKLDFDQHRYLASTLGVSRIPTILVLSPDANKLLSRVHNTHSTMFVRELKKATEKMEMGQSLRSGLMLK